MQNIIHILRSRSAYTCFGQLQNPIRKKERKKKKRKKRRNRLFEICKVVLGKCVCWGVVDDIHVIGDYT